MSYLVLVRHGQSDWNLNNRFAGWSDNPPLLTERGAKDAVTCAEHLKKFKFDIAFTSRLQRGYKTLEIILEALGQADIELIYDSALNERHYGDLQGLNRAETAEKHGEAQVKLWRRSYSTPPPNGESIADCVRRVIPFFKQYVMPHVEAGKNVIMGIHGNSMRPIIKYLENIEDGEKVASMEIALSTPYIYEFKDGKMIGSTIMEIPGVVTRGGSMTEKTVEQ